MLEKVIEWLKAPVDEVPEELAVCEFECCETQCPEGGWGACKHRLGYIAGARQEKLC